MIEGTSAGEATLQVLQSSGGHRPRRRVFDCQKHVSVYQTPACKCADGTPEAVAADSLVAAAGVEERASRDRIMHSQLHARSCSA